MMAIRIRTVGTLIVSTLLAACSPSSSPIVEPKVGSPLGSPNGEGQGARKEPSTPATAAEHHWTAGRVRFSDLSVKSERAAGTVWIDKQPIVFETRVDEDGTLVALIEDRGGNRFVSQVRPDGARALHYNYREVLVDKRGSVDRKSFAGLPPELGAALALIPLEISCSAGKSGDRWLAALSLPFNLVQRAEPRFLKPGELIAAVSCSKQAIRFHSGSHASITGGVAPERLIARSRLVVGPMAASKESAR